MTIATIVKASLSLSSKMITGITAISKSTAKIQMTQQETKRQRLALHFSSAQHASPLPGSDERDSESLSVDILNLSLIHI